MIESGWLYIGFIVLLGTLFWWLEMHSRYKIFTWLPAIVVLYLLCILLAHYGIFARSPQLADAYKNTKAWLLPMMLFLMLLQLNLRAFAGLGRKLILAYLGAVVSMALAFVGVFYLFGFDEKAAGVFGALSGSWTGGTANMLAVAGALGISDTQLGPALIVDSILYTVWIMLLLFLVPFAPRADRFFRALPLNESAHVRHARSATRFQTMLLAFLSVAAAYFAQRFAPLLPLLPSSTWLVLCATFFGVAASFTPLRALGDSSRPASVLLYSLIALIGSHASLGGFADVPIYLAAAAAILAVHALLMLLLARCFRLNLFSIGVASLANIGGVASAPILAAAYHRNLVGVAVLMAVMGYLIGTLAGLGIAYVLQAIAA